MQGAATAKLPLTTQEPRDSADRMRWWAETRLEFSKKKSLEESGWKIGSADEFLDLSADESAYIDLKRRLSQSLRKRRTEKKVSQQQLASLIKSSQSRVAKMEAGDPTVSIDILVKTLLALGASDRDLAKAIAAR